MATTPQRKKRRQQGRPNYRLIRYADDFVVVIHGERADADALRDDIAAVLAPAGLRLSETKTTIAHIDEGFDFLVATRGRTARASSLIGGSSV